jgi:hypothetical protein
MEPVLAQEALEHGRCFGVWIVHLLAVTKDSVKVVIIDVTSITLVTRINTAFLRSSVCPAVTLCVSFVKQFNDFMLSVARNEAAVAYTDWIAGFGFAGQAGVE